MRNFNDLYEKTGLLRDEKGAFYGIPNIKGKPRVSSMPYLYDISEGNIIGHEAWFKLGYNSDVGTTEEDVWDVGGSYVFPTAEMGMEIVSSDNTQDKPDGTGALTVHLHYLDGEFNEHDTSGTLNGTTPVALDVTNIYRITTFHLLSTGTGLKAVGNVDLRHIDNTPIYARISAGHTFSRSAVITIPVHKKACVYSLHMSAGGTAKPIIITLKSNYYLQDNKIYQFMFPYGEIQCTDSQFPLNFEAPLCFPAGSDIKVSAKGNVVSGLCTCSIRGWVEND